MPESPTSPPETKERTGADRASVTELRPDSPLFRMPAQRGRGASIDSHEGGSP